MTGEPPADPGRAPGPDAAGAAEPSPLTAGPPTRVDPSSADARGDDAPATSDGLAAAPTSDDAPPVHDAPPGHDASPANDAPPGHDASPANDAPAAEGAAPATPALPPGVRRYVRDGAAVTYEVALCRHAAECVRGLPAVFDTTKRPWIRPENASVDELEDVIARCPTRALKFEREPAIRDPATPA